MPTPDGPGEPFERPVLEPIRVLRPRNTDALAELFREMTEDTDAYEAVPLPQPRPGAEADTEELPPVGRRAAPRRERRASPGERRAPTRQRRTPSRQRGQASRGRGGDPARRRRGDDRARRPADEPYRDRTAGPHRIAIAALAVLAAALVGFACALLLPARGGQAAAQTPPAAPAAPASPAPTATPPAATAPDGGGTLSEGDSGPQVTDLQERLRRIPNVYDGGATDGRYDTVLTEAVARFQLWYGIRGDETGVYGDDTRRDLESRTG
ncbi:peptidoglycan-binding protein [Streptomyces sp. NPDC002328]|uniref:peptidoglycan-binding domain-containing protein n=1 Tax=Streptomyces sp. NPDC002328 TaxID=3364642 RepID=UPI0036A72E2A